MKRKRMIICMILAALVLLCTGCDLDTGGSLFALPELSGQYAHLQRELDKVLGQGATYTVASTGSVRSSVQMADLNGDGKDEAIGLFLSAAGVPEVHVFRMEEDDCTWLGKLQGVGNSVREIRYFSRGTQGQLALAVSWAYENNARYYGMTVAGMGGDEVFTMLDLHYAACLPQDLDGDGVEELTYIRPGSSEEASYASIYQLEGDSYRLLCRESLCTEAQSVQKLRYAAVQEGRTALVVDSSAREGGYVTDVLDFDGESLVNWTRDAVTGSGAAFLRKAAVPAYDINGDGLLELPQAMADGIGGEAEHRISWLSLEGKNEGTVLCGTYQQAEEGWAFLWPEEWPWALQAGVNTETSVRENVSTTAFYIWEADPATEQLNKRTLMTIWAFQGEERERERTKHYLVTPLNIDGEILFGYTLEEQEVLDEYTMTDARVKSLFHQMTDNLEGGNG